MKELSEIVKENNLTPQEIHQVVGIMHQKGYFIYSRSIQWKTSYERAFEVYTKRYITRPKNRRLNIK